MRLAGELPAQETAAHVIGYGKVIKRTISMIESHTLTPPAHDQPGRMLEPGDHGQAVARRMTARIEDAREAAITVVGSHVNGSSDRWSEAPILLHRHAVRAWLLGHGPGQVVTVEKPPQPAWMVKKRLVDTSTRRVLDSQFSTRLRRGHPVRLKARQYGSLGPGEFHTEGEVGTWAKLLLTAQLGRGDLALWEEYRTVAALLRAGVGWS